MSGLTTDMAMLRSASYVATTYTSWRIVFFINSLSRTSAVGETLPIFQLTVKIFRWSICCICAVISFICLRQVETAGSTDALSKSKCDYTSASPQQTTGGRSVLYRPANCFILFNSYCKSAQIFKFSSFDILSSNSRSTSFWSVSSYFTCM